MAAGRKQDWRDKYARTLGLRPTDRDEETNEVVVVACGFCVAFGREPLAESAVQEGRRKQRKRSTNVAKWTRPFRSDNIRSHLVKIHAHKWEEYSELLRQLNNPEERVGAQQQLDSFFDQGVATVQVAESRVVNLPVASGGEQPVLLEEITTPEIVETLVDEFYVEDDDCVGTGAKDSDLMKRVLQEQNDTMRNQQTVNANQTEKFLIRVMNKEELASVQRLLGIGLTFTQIVKTLASSTISAITVRSYARISTAASLQMLSTIMRRTWIYSIALQVLRCPKDKSRGGGERTSVLQLRVRLPCSRGTDVADLHVMALPLPIFERSPVQVVAFIELILNILDPNWRTKLLGGCVNGPQTKWVIDAYLRRALQDLSEGSVQDHSYAHLPPPSFWLFASVLVDILSEFKEAVNNFERFPLPSRTESERILELCVNEFAKNSRISRNSSNETILEHGMCLEGDSFRVGQFCWVRRSGLVPYLRSLNLSMRRLYDGLPTGDKRIVEWEVAGFVLTCLDSVTEISGSSLLEACSLMASTSMLGSKTVISDSPPSLPLDFVSIERMDAVDLIECYSDRLEQAYDLVFLDNISGDIERLKVMVADNSSLRFELEHTQSKSFRDAWDCVPDLSQLRVFAAGLSTALPRTVSGCTCSLDADTLQAVAIALQQRTEDQYRVNLGDFSVEARLHMEQAHTVKALHAEQQKNKMSICQITPLAFSVKASLDKKHAIFPTRMLMQVVTPKHANIHAPGGSMASAHWSSDDQALLDILLMTEPDGPKDVDMQDVFTPLPAPQTLPQVQQEVQPTSPIVVHAKKQTAKDSPKGKLSAMSAAPDTARWSSVPTTATRSDNGAALNSLRDTVKELEEQLEKLSMSKQKQTDNAAPKSKPTDEIQRRYALLTNEQEELGNEAARLRLLLNYRQHLVNRGDVPFIITHVFRHGLAAGHARRVSVERDAEDQDAVLQRATSDVRGPDHHREDAAGNGHAEATGLQALSFSESSTLVNEMYRCILSFSLNGKAISTGASIMGWEDKRLLDGTSLKFSLRKRFLGQNPLQLMTSTWQCFSDPECTETKFRGLMTLRILQRVNDDTIVALRESRSEDGAKLYRCVYILFRVRTRKGFLICVRSVSPERLTDPTLSCSSRDGKPVQWTELQDGSSLSLPLTGTEHRSSTAAVWTTATTSRSPRLP
ncbi:hypothetical protein GQ600_11785 [Phytophthora cactorum]|nr:hypothetical protein GQ600_11785 [Phytophthora cactorum]